MSLRNSLKPFAPVVLWIGLAFVVDCRPVFSNDVPPESSVGEEDDIVPAKATIPSESTDLPDPLPLKGKPDVELPGSNSPGEYDNSEPEPKVTKHPKQLVPQSSMLIPTTWDKKAQLIPTDIDAVKYMVQKTGHATTARAAAHAAARLKRRNPIPRQSAPAVPAVQRVEKPEGKLSRTGDLPFESLFIPALSVNSAVGIATLSKIPTHPPEPHQPGVSVDLPIRREALETVGSKQGLPAEKPKPVAASVKLKVQPVGSQPGKTSTRQK